MNDRASLGLKKITFFCLFLSPLSPSLLWPQRYLISLMFENKIKCKKIIYYLQSSRCCTPLCASFFNSVPICIPRQFSFTPARLMLLQFYFVYYVKHRRALLRMKFLFHIFFVVVAGRFDIATQWRKEIHIRASPVACPIVAALFFWRCTQLCSLPSSPARPWHDDEDDDDDDCSFVVQREKEESNKRASISDLANIRRCCSPLACTQDGGRRGEMKSNSLALEKHKTSHFHFYNSPQPDRTELRRERRGKRAAKLVQFHIKRCSDERWYIVFTFDLFAPSAPRPPRATLQTLFILSWAVVSCFFFPLFFFRVSSNIKFLILNSVFLAAQKNTTTLLEMKWFRVCAAVAFALEALGYRSRTFNFSSFLPHSSYLAADDAIEIVSWKQPATTHRVAAGKNLPIS